MADKNNKSDTLDQQRKAREEFLHLKRMQSGDEAPPEPTPEITPETINEKAKNFWYYYRWPVIGLIFIIIVVAICVVQCASKVKYDLRIVLYTSKAVSDADCEHIAEYFKKYAEDSNNDGKVNVEVVNCSYTAGTNGQSIMAINTKIQAIIAAEYDVMLFITDATTYKYLNSISEPDGLLEEDYTIDLDDDFYNKCDTDEQIPLPENLTIARRAISNTVMQKEKKAKGYYDDAGKFLDNYRK